MAVRNSDFSSKFSSTSYSTDSNPIIHSIWLCSQIVLHYSFEFKNTFHYDQKISENDFLDSQLLIGIFKKRQQTISLEIESLVLICLVMKQVNVMKKMYRNIEETFQTVLKYIFIVLSLLFSYRNINYINVGLIKISIVPFINFKICSSNYGTCWKNTHIT